jgi:hypothetical protein
MKKLLILAGLVSMAAPASTQDLDAMVRWTSATIVHYRLVGEFSGDVPILGESISYWKASVSDHVEFELDWNQADFNLVGQPIIRNSPTKIVRMIPRPECPAAKVDGTLEQLTLTAVRTDEGKRMVGIVMLDTRRDQPAGSYPYGGESLPCGTAWQPSPARSETATMNIQLPPGMMLAMPGAYKLTADKKSFLMKDEGTGWTWTITPTIVR